MLLSNITHCNVQGLHSHMWCHRVEQLRPSICYLLAKVPFNGNGAGPGRLVKALAYKAVLHVRVNQAVDTLYDRYANDVADKLPENWWEGWRARMSHISLRRSFKRSVKGHVTRCLEHGLGEEVLVYQVFKAYRPVPQQFEFPRQFRSGSQP
jgi:hypothetical protein